MAVPAFQQPGDRRFDGLGKNGGRDQLDLRPGGWSLVSVIEAPREPALHL
ncbi:MAG: hypothetical protein IT307_03165 [Chloroflexi bacterium]|nr:hypothetical protein [Chloroflexota bacterium]